MYVQYREHFCYTKLTWTERFSVLLLDVWIQENRQLLKLMIPSPLLPDLGLFTNQRSSIKNLRLPKLATSHLVYLLSLQVYCYCILTCSGYGLLLSCHAPCQIPL